MINAWLSIMVKNQYCDDLLFQCYSTIEKHLLRLNRCRSWHWPCNVAAHVGSVSRMPKRRFGSYNRGDPETQFWGGSDRLPINHQGETDGELRATLFSASMRWLVLSMFLSLTTWGWLIDRNILGMRDKHQLDSVVGYPFPFRIRSRESEARAGHATSPWTTPQRFEGDVL